MQKAPGVISVVNIIFFSTANVDVAACFHGKAALPGADVLSW